MKADEDSLCENQENIETISVIKTNGNTIEGATLIFNKEQEQEILERIQQTLNTNTEYFNDQSGGWKEQDRFKTKDGRFGRVNFKRNESYYAKKGYYNVTFEKNDVTETLYPESDMFDPISPEEKRRMAEEALKLDQQKRLIALKKAEQDRLDAQAKVIAANKIRIAALDAQKQKEIELKEKKLRDSEKERQEKQKEEDAKRAEIIKKKEIMINNEIRQLENQKNQIIQQRKAAEDAASIKDNKEIASIKTKIASLDKQIATIESSIQQLKSHKK